MAVRRNPPVKVGKRREMYFFPSYSWKAVPLKERDASFDVSESPFFSYCLAYFIASRKVLLTRERAAARAFEADPGPVFTSDPSAASHTFVTTSRQSRQSRQSRRQSKESSGIFNIFFRFFELKLL